LNETVDLSVLTGNSVTFIEHVVAHRRLQAISAPGLSFPLHCTANGKALLATLTDSRIRELLPGRLEKLTGNTCLLRSQLEVELEDVRSLGYAFDREEHTVGICAIGTAVEGNTKSEYWALSVPMPSSRFYGHENRLVQALLREAERIRAAITRPQHSTDVSPNIR
jgi:DNA-binding IclR family transcriptional regulator